MKFLMNQSSARIVEAGTPSTIQAIIKIVRLLYEICSTGIILNGLIKAFHKFDCLLPV
jgi:hypothetical protein